MAAAAALLVSSPAHAQAPVKTPREIVIGCALPLTGPDAAIGVRALQGALVAVDAFGDAGPGLPLALAVRDTGGTPEGATRAVTALAGEEGAVAIVGPLTSRESPGAASTAQRLRVPIVTLTQREGITAPGDFVFRALLTPHDQAQAVARHAAEGRHDARFAIVYPDDNFGRDLARAFTEAAAASGGRVVRASAYRGPADLPDAVDRVLDRRPGAQPGPPPFEAIFVPDNAAMGRLIATRLEVAGLKHVRLLGIALWNGPDAMQGRSLEGAIFTAPYFSGSPRATTRRFAASYRKTFGGEPEAFAAQAHDATALLVDILRTEPGAGRERVRWKLQNAVGFEGAAGPLSFDGGRDGRREAMILTIRGGRIVPAEPADAWDLSPN